MTKQSLNVSLQASCFSFGELEHPNKMPFEGLMTWLNSPSDKPVGGAGGKRVVIPVDHGKAGLASLKGMAVNFDSLMMDRHVSTNKVGVIEDAWCGDANEEGAVPVYVKGYIYAHDFPEEARMIKEEQADLGFSYETVDTAVVHGIHEGELVLMACEDIVFSGAAILLKQKAAYTNTSLVAQAEESEVENLEIEKLVEAVISAIEAKFELKAKADEEEKVEEKPEEKVEEVKGEEKAEEQEEKEEKVEEPAEKEEEVELKAGAEEVDFKAMAEDYKAKFEALEAKMDKVAADLKAEADAREANNHKGFAYPTTLVAKYNLDASADTYEAKIAAVDAREDLSVDEKMALKFELRSENLKQK